MDKKTLDLAQSIYDNYGDIIEFIYNNTSHVEVNDSLETRTWDGKSWFFNIGDGDTAWYSWDDFVNYSFICAGGGLRYTKIMEKFKKGDIIYAYSSRSGYVGIGEALNTAIPFRNAILPDGNRLKNKKLKGKYNDSEDNSECEWVLFVKWLKVTLDKSKAVREKPIVPSTAARIYNHNKQIVNKIKKGL